MKVLEIYFESEAKKTYWIIFLMYFLNKLTCDCKSENTSFPAQKMINFEMWGKTPPQIKTPKNNPKPEYVHLGTIYVSSVQSFGQNSTVTYEHVDWGCFKWPEMKL